MGDNCEFLKDVAGLLREHPTGDVLIARERLQRLFELGLALDARTAALPPTPPPAFRSGDFDDDRLIALDYVNHAGARNVYSVIPIELYFGSTPWHPTPQWLLRAWKVEPNGLQVRRDFAMSDVFAWARFRGDEWLAAPDTSGVPPHWRGTAVPGSTVLEQGLGRKGDNAKSRWDLLPMEPVAAVVDVLTYGAKKYTPDNWKHVPNPQDRYFAALMRHLAAWRQGQRVDPESDLRHLAHAACCLLFLLWFEVREKGEVSRG